MDRGRDNGFYDGAQGGGLPNLPYSHTFSLNSPSWYTPTPQLAPSNSFVWNQSHQDSNNYDETFTPSNAFGESSFSSRGIGILHLESRVPITPSFNIDFTNQVINPLNRIVDSGCNISRGTYTKRLWTSEEDSKLNALVSVFGTKNWAMISDFMDGRVGKQCRERWNNNLRPDIKSDVWSEEEERILIQAHEKRGNKWSQIAKLLPGRTENAVKNHWNAATRKKTMRLNRYKRYEPSNAKPKSTLLRDYIRGMSSASTKKSATTNDNIVTVGEFTTITQDDQLSSDLILPACNNDQEFSFMKNLFSTSDHMADQVLEPHNLQANMNPQVLEPHGTSSILMEDSLDMYLNGNCQTVSEPAATILCNASEPVSRYGDVNMDLAFDAQGGGFSSL